MLVLRPMSEEDLPAVAAWLRLPHVARWWTSETTAEEEISRYRAQIRQAARSATVMLMISQDGTSIGWCQWYRWADYPAEAAAMDAREGEAGIDYAIGDPARVGRGIGTELIAELVAEAGRSRPSPATRRWPSTGCRRLPGMNRHRRDDLPTATVHQHSLRERSE
jgi:aminoglycoside 6'-N-acetyltransferase